MTMKFLVCHIPVLLFFENTVSQYLYPRIENTVSPYLRIRIPVLCNTAA
jgi:hypothetical protein